MTEEEVKAAFVSAYNQLVVEKKEIIANAELIRRMLCVMDALLEEKGKLEDEMAVLVEMMQTIVGGECLCRTKSGRVPETLQLAGQAVR